MVLVTFDVGPKVGRVFGIIMAEFQVGAERWVVDRWWNLVVTMLAECGWWRRL